MRPILRLLDCLLLGTLGGMLVTDGYRTAGFILVGVGIGLAIGQVAGTLWPLDQEAARR